ncbi:glycosyltransferase family 2 protein [Nibrella saemangeumensis]|uniref:Glycosyltransferase family 2 protein n=1 Tax=Nibrella saemangeumensis TaxID=1084526 RepID=A0ABP8NPF8_9BACT
MDQLAIVILNYNGQSYLERFLPSVLAHADGFPVYVADNASTDNSVALLRDRFPEVHLLQLTRNDGYAGGYNAALQQIKARFYILLNSDVEVTPGWIWPVLNLLEHTPRMAACQPKIRSYDRRSHFEYAGAAGGFIDWLGFAFCRGRLFDTLEEDYGQYDDDRPVFWATGACLFVRADVFHQTGGFDELFFAHMEEIDWCWRVQRLGYEVWTCGQSVVYHVGGGTLPKTNPQKTYLNYRNSLMMLYKNLPSDRLFDTLLLRLVVDGLSSARFLLTGQWRDIGAILRAHFAFYGRLRDLRLRRRQLPAQTEATHLPVYTCSIIWDYFAKGRKTFAALNWSAKSVRWPS